MEDRVQLILVLTGIGATSVDSSAIPSEEEESGDIEISEPISLNTFQTSGNSQVTMAGSPTNLDVPAFMRRRLN